MLNYWTSRVSTAIFGDAVDAALQAKPTSYEEVHAEVQSVLLPPVYPKGISVYALQALNKHFAIQHK
jgi:hypothetical protein